MSQGREIENFMSETSGETPVNNTVSKISRRSFLKRAGGAALGLVGLSVLKGIPNSQSAEAYDNKITKEEMVVLGVVATGVVASELLARQNSGQLVEVNKDLENCQPNFESNQTQSVEAAEDLAWIKDVNFVDIEGGNLNPEMTQFAQTSLEKFAKAAAVSAKVKTLVDSWKVAIENSPSAKSFEKVAFEVNYKTLSPDAVPETGLYFMIPQPRLYKDENKIGLTFVIFPDVIKRFDLKPGGLFSLVNFYKCNAYREAFRKVIEGGMSLGSNLNDEGYDGSLLAPKIQDSFNDMYKASFEGFAELMKDQGVAKAVDPATGKRYIEDDLSRYISK